jgi:hypothetical protein
MSQIKIIPPQFEGDRYQIIRVYGYHSAPIAWAHSLQEAREIKARYA